MLTFLCRPGWRPAAALASRSDLPSCLSGHRVGLRYCVTPAAFARRGSEAAQQSAGRKEGAERIAGDMGAGEL